MDMIRGTILVLLALLPVDATSYYPPPSVQVAWSECELILCGKVIKLEAIEPIRNPHSTPMPETLARKLLKRNGVKIGRRQKAADLIHEILPFDTKVTIEVYETFKGKEDTVIEIFTSAGKPMSGAFDFKIHGEYLVYAQNRFGFYDTGITDRTDSIVWDKEKNCIYMGISHSGDSDHPKKSEVLQLRAFKEAEKSKSSPKESK